MTSIARSIGASLLAATLLGSATGALAADASAQAGPLAPAKPAGVAQAQIYGQTVLLVALGAAFIGGVIALANSQNHTTNASSGT